MLNKKKFEFEIFFEIFVEKLELRALRSKLDGNKPAGHKYPNSILYFDIASESDKWNRLLDWKTLLNMYE